MHGSFGFDALPEALARVSQWVPEHGALLLCALALVGIALHALAGADDRRSRQPARRHPRNLV